ncbi:MAG: hypothetical protein IT290_00745, partial [Deltaproteobacteria bacterium]|nr:hypothetical protein [Deltaproteobacteria bacterium]
MRNAPFERSLRRWANIWLVIVLLLAAWLGIRLSRGDAFETDLLSLLPPSSREPLVAESLRQFVKLSSDRLVFLVTDPSDFEAKEAAVHLADRLRASGFFSEIRDRFDGDYQAEIDRFFFPHRYALYGEARERSLVAPDAVAHKTQNIAEIRSAPLSGSHAAHLDDDPLLYYPDIL